MESINITEDLCLTLLVGGVTILVGIIILYCIQRSLFEKTGKIFLLFCIAVGGIFTLLTWPVCIYHKPLSRFYPEGTIYVWDYYGFPFPIHKSHEYFPKLTMSITRHPFFGGLLANFLIYSLLIMIAYKLIILLRKKLLKDK